MRPSTYASSLRRVLASAVPIFVSPLSPFTHRPATAPRVVIAFRSTAGCFSMSLAIRVEATAARGASRSGKHPRTPWCAVLR